MDINYKDITLKKELLPKHIAFIMDGNGRWAKKRGMPRTFGHHEGTKNIRTLALEANRIGIKAMTVYAFSTENFKRPEEEVKYIFKLPMEFFTSYIKELKENNVKVSFIGNLNLAPEETQKIILRAVDETKDNTGLILNFAFIYGSQDEIVQAVKGIAEDVVAGKFEISDINEELIDSYLMTASLPEVDYMIRTSGECRLSNFLLWQLAYAELYFTDTYWPDFGIDELYKSLDIYQKRNRRYGGLK